MSVTRKFERFDERNLRPVVAGSAEQPEERSMLRAFAAIVVGAWLAMPAASQAISPEAAFVGVWKQVFSTGGRCADCTVSISRNQDGLRADASNGWAVSLTKTSVGGNDALVGSGKWTYSKSGQPVAREIATGFQLLQGHLVLMMQIIDESGKKNRVKAIFEQTSPATDQSTL